MKNKIISIKLLLIIAVITFLANNQLFAQCGAFLPWCSSPSGNSLTGGEILGGNSSSIAPLQIHMDGPYSIEFYTSTFSSNPIKHMELDKYGDLNLTNYYDPAGTIPTPADLNAYRIGGSKVLCYENGNSNNLFVGTANVTITKKIFATNFVVHAANQPDIDLQEKINTLENEIALLQKRLDEFEKLTAKN